MNQTEIVLVLKEVEAFYTELNLRLEAEWQIAKTSRKAKVSKVLTEVIRSLSNVKMILSILEAEADTSQDPVFWEGLQKAALSDAEKQIELYLIVKEAANVQ